ncbi:PREDICTED: NAD-dependent protein deacetylase sirtuin-7 [Nicrophorus vespilloides]|uniref:Regulatory protein SIR2 homolog 7 n=1 Tax=Nicrophorus vespilloides TaxID=110193 RepID=A0ABM1MKJ6_NICVS|nr:PREDICTED: NAD-dependent protein deacetylase sirtuin-7 [Nicrophorus vespilloides]
MEIDNCDVPEVDTDDDLNVSKRLLRKQQVKQLCAKDERNATIKKVSLVLQKPELDRTNEDIELLTEYNEIVKEVQARWKKRDAAKRRLEEFEEPVEQLRDKCNILAQAIAQSQHLVVYTGAGISTAARIPDYRGTNGIWTRLQQGKDIGNHDLSLAEPTYTHMALSELYRRKILKYVVSQNCDGLHLRSGLPRTAISEVHGNMYIEVCKSCKPFREYWRLFDVTENTARYSHKTMRKCYVCNGPLVDTIVHFGERGSLPWPLNWSGASKNARKATTILCLGSSLKVLKKYPWLWQMHKPQKRRPNLYIVNLQWTPKDDAANAKIHGKCDIVMEIVMDLLGIPVPKYDRDKDPIFVHGTILSEPELHTTTQPLLKYCKLEKVEVKEEEITDDQPIDYCTNKDLKSSIDLKKPDGENCDKLLSNIYSITGKAPIPLGLPNTQTMIPHSNASVFSIDDILKRTDTENLLQNNLLLKQNCQALLTYYQISNTILQNPVFAYRDMLTYPIQSSLLYSGLHSIINPLPYITEEHNYSSTSDKDDAKERETAKCEFCYKHYKSTDCVFYNKTEPVFAKQELRFSKMDNVDKPLYCTCCDYTTEEDEDNDEDVSPDKISKISDESSEQKSKVQPGWFGKGYRKLKKYKKRISS